MADDPSSSGGRLRPAPRRASAIGAAAALFCLAVALLGWAGHTLLQAESAPAREVSSGSNVFGSQGTQRDVSRRAQGNNSAERQERDRRSAERAEQAEQTAKKNQSPAKWKAIERPAETPAIEPPAKTKAAKPPVVAPPKPQPEPERIAIPALGVDQDLVELAVIGTKLQVPDDYDDVGWWNGGPVPGESGAAVVVGHVDSLTGPAVFYGLSDLQRGDRIFTWEKDGPRSTFEVRKTLLYDRDDFPSDRVYRTQGRPSLHLLTCGGSFDEETGQYTGNVVVFATEVNRPGGDERQARQERQERQERHQGQPRDRQLRQLMGLLEYEYDQHQERPQDRQLRQLMGLLEYEYDQRQERPTEQNDRHER